MSLTINPILTTDTFLQWVTEFNKLANNSTGFEVRLDQIESLLGSNSLTTTSPTVTGAINELDGEIGDISLLNTTDTTSLVHAINEVHDFVDAAYNVEHLAADPPFPYIPLFYYNTTTNVLMVQTAVGWVECYGSTGSSGGSSGSGSTTPPGTGSGSTPPPTPPATNLSPGLDTGMVQVYAKIPNPTAKSAVAYDDIAYTAYMIGGIGSDKVYSIDLDDDQTDAIDPLVVEVATLPYELQEAWAYYDGALIYVIGGKTPTTNFNDEILEIDPLTGVVTVVGNLPFGITRTDGYFDGSNVYLFGGMKLANDGFSTEIIKDIQQVVHSTWSTSTVAYLNMTKSDVAVSAIGTDIYIVGGTYDLPESRSNEVLKYDLTNPSTDPTIVAFMPDFRAEGKLFTNQTDLFYVSGYGSEPNTQGFGWSNKVLRIIPSYSFATIDHISIPQHRAWAPIVFRDDIEDLFIFAGASPLKDEILRVGI